MRTVFTLWLLCSFYALPAEAQNLFFPDPPQAPVSKTGKKVKTIAKISYNAGGQKTGFAVDSFSFNGLKLKWTNQLDYEHSPLYPGYTITYKYNSESRFSGSLASNGDTAEYIYNEKENIHTLCAVMDGKNVPWESYSFDASGDTLQYLHFSNGEASSGWKKEYDFLNGRKEAVRYYTYTINYYDNNGVKVHPGWVFRYTCNYYYSRELTDSICCYDGQSKQIRKDVFFYDKKNRLISRKRFEKNAITQVTEYSFNKQGLPVSFKTIYWTNDKKNTMQHCLRYNKEGLPDREEFLENKKRKQRIVYEYAYYN